MKIIGKAEGPELILKASVEELANFAGFYSAYADGFNRDPQVGMTYPVGKMYADARAMLDTHKEALEAGKKLRQASDKFLSFFKDDTNKK